MSLGFREVVVRCANWIIESAPNLPPSKVKPQSLMKVPHDSAWINRSSMEQSLRPLCHFTTNPEAEAVIHEFLRLEILSINTNGSIKWSDAPYRLYTHSLNQSQDAHAEATARTLADWLLHSTESGLLPQTVSMLNAQLKSITVTLEVSAEDVIDLLMEVGILRQLKTEGTGRQNFSINYPCSLGEWSKRLASNVSHWPLQPELLDCLEQCDALESQALYWLVTMLDGRDKSPLATASEGDCRSEGNNQHLHSLELQEDEMQLDTCLEQKEEELVPFTDEEEQWYVSRMEEIAFMEGSDSDFELAWAQSQEPQVEERQQDCCGSKRKSTDVETADRSTFEDVDVEAKRARWEGVARKVARKDAASRSGDIDAIVDCMDISAIALV
jgi:hypothetical protein